jgi:vacuolar-type H+-ATPase subunit I/STV1
MAKVGAQRAAELTGRSKSTIQRAMNSGKISFEVDANGRRVIDVSELDRGFGLLSSSGGAPAGNSVEDELEKASSMLEMERMKMRIRMLEEQLESANAQIDDLKGQRDQWQKQASQVLLTSAYTQKQAEELREELKERERRAQERRQQRLDEQMKKLKPDNQNTSNQATADSSAFKGLWKRTKKSA